MIMFGYVCIKICTLVIWFSSTKIPACTPYSVYAEHGSY